MKKLKTGVAYHGNRMPSHFREDVKEIVDVLNMCKTLKKQGETVISNQISRSATSICANIAESKYAHGRADFIMKLFTAFFIGFKFV